MYMLIDVSARICINIYVCTVFKERTTSSRSASLRHDAPLQAQGRHRKETTTTTPGSPCPRRGSTISPLPLRRSTSPTTPATAGSMAAGSCPRPTWRRNAQQGVAHLHQRPAPAPHLHLLPRGVSRHLQRHNDGAREGKGTLFSLFSLPFFLYSIN
jgi:hypothetical protein